MKTNTPVWAYKNQQYLLFLLFFTTGIISAQPVSQTFNSSGTYTIPAGYSANVTIEARGGGGGGGSNTGDAKGGGGGGAYASETTTLNAGNYTVTVGAGGGAGTAGGNSSFTTIVVAEGGQSTTGTTGGAGGTTAGSTGTTKVAGVSGSNISGNNGGAGGAGGNGGGAGGAGGAANNGSGVSGTAPGGGGGGKAGPGGGGLSGSGANGRVVVTVNLVLPVRIRNTRVVEENGGARIEWTVAEESGMDKYRIERSVNGYDFTIIGEVVSANSFSEKTYTFLDVNAAEGLSFYRIRTVELTGKTGLSNIMRFDRRKTEDALNVYPVPVKVGSYLSFSTQNLPRGNYFVKIFNASGQDILSQNFRHNGGSLNQTIQLPVFVKAGSYTLRLECVGIKVLSKGFLVY